MRCKGASFNPKVLGSSPSGGTGLACSCGLLAPVLIDPAPRSEVDGRVFVGVWSGFSGRDRGEWNVARLSEFGAVCRV